MRLFDLPALPEQSRRGLFLAANLFLLAFAVMMIWTATGPKMRLPWYDPLGHRWSVSTAAPTFVSMDYYARVGLSLAVGVSAGVAGAFLGRKRPLPPVLGRALTLWALGLTLIGLALYGYQLGTRVIEPPPPGTITQPESD